MENYSQKNWDNVKKSLHKRRKDGGCSMWRKVGIRTMVKIGKWNDLYDWEKEFFRKGVELNLWDKFGNKLNRINE